MNTDLLAELLIGGMPWSVALKTLAFVTLWVILWRQDSDTPLGRWINRFFLMTFVSSLLVTDLVLYLAKVAEASDITGLQEWTLIVGFNVAPVATAFCGYKVAIWTQRTAKSETKDARDLRQDAQAAVLDRTSLVLARRGEKLSDAGVILDDRRLAMDTERQELDERQSQDGLP